MLLSAYIGIKRLIYAARPSWRQSAPTTLPLPSSRPARLLNSRTTSLECTILLTPERAVTRSISSLLHFCHPLTHVQFSAGNVFQYVDPNGNLHTIIAGAQSHTFSVAGKLASNKGYPVQRRRIQRRAITYNGCTPNQQQIIAAAASSCDAYAAAAGSYLNSISSGTRRYTVCSPHPWVDCESAYTRYDY